MGRILIALFCLAAAGGLGYAALSDRWLVNDAPAHRTAFSLLSSKRCVDATCESKSNSELMTELTMQAHADASMAFATAGQATLGLSMLSVLMLLICTGYLVAGKRTAGPNGPQHLALVALMLAIVAATVFVKTKPGGTSGVTGVGAGAGFYVFAVACVLGIFAAQLATKHIKPVEAEGELTL